MLCILAIATNNEIVGIRQWSFHLVVLLSRKFVDAILDVFTISSSHVCNNLSKTRFFHVQLLISKYSPISHVLLQSQ